MNYHNILWRLFHTCFLCFFNINYTLTFTVLSRWTGQTVSEGVAGIDRIVRSFRTWVLVWIAGSYWTVVSRGTELLREGC